MTDYRALCAELVQDIEEWIVAVDHCPPSSSALVQRARAALAQPEPQGPTDEEICSFIARVWPHSPGEMHDCEWRAGMMMMIHAAIEELFLPHWGRLAAEPVPVAERLPGPEDCSSRGYFWAYAGDDWEETDIDGMNWQHLHHHGYTHWLPHHALPLPTSQENLDGNLSCAEHDTIRRALEALPDD